MNIAQLLDFIKRQQQLLETVQVKEGEIRHKLAGLKKEMMLELETF
jgi:hypothetical protein